MKFTVKKGNHYSWPPHAWPWIGKRQISRYVTFDDSCAYDSPAYNAQDINKLFGLSFGLRGVHHNSARFGWRWSQSDQCIELLAYVYNEGNKNWDQQLRFPVVAQVALGEIVVLEIVHDEDGYTFSAHTVGGGYCGSASVMAGVPASLPSYGLTHGLYFGGSLLCPHDMHVQIDRV